MSVCGGGGCPLHISDEDAKSAPQLEDKFGDVADEAKGEEEADGPRPRSSSECGVAWAAAAMTLLRRQKSRGKGGKRGRVRDEDEMDTHGTKERGNELSGRAGATEEKSPRLLPLLQLTPTTKCCSWWR